MIKESGRVVAIDNDCLWVETIRQSTCNSCSAQKGCGHGMLNKMGSGRRHHLRVLLRGLPASSFSIDDEVIVSIPERVLVVGAVIVYLLPLVTLLLGALLASLWWQGDIASFIGAVLGFVAGIGTVKYHAITNRDNPALQPVIIGKQNPLSADPLQVVNPA